MWYIRVYTACIDRQHSDIRSRLQEEPRYALCAVNVVALNKSIGIIDVTRGYTVNRL